MWPQEMVILGTEVGALDANSYIGSSVGVAVKWSNGFILGTETNICVAIF